MATLSPKGIRPPAPKDETSPAAVSEAKPSAVFRFRNVSVAVFPHQVKTDGGGTRTTFNVSVRKGFKDSEGKWQHGHTFWPEELPLAIAGLQKCYEHLMERDSSTEE